MHLAAINDKPDALALYAPLSHAPSLSYTHKHSLFSHTLSHSLSLCLSLSLTHAHSLSLTRTCTHTFSLYLTHTLFLSLSLSHTHTPSLSLFLSLTHTHTLSLSLSLTLSFSLSLSHTLTAGALCPTPVRPSTSKAFRCREDSAQIRRSRPDSGLELSHFSVSSP